MEKEFVKILVCEKCLDIAKNKDMIYNHEENGIRYSCTQCDEEIYYNIGLIVIGTEACADTLQVLDGGIDD